MNVANTEPAGLPGKIWSRERENLPKNISVDLT